MGLMLLLGPLGRYVGCSKLFSYTFRISWFLSMNAWSHPLWTDLSVSQRRITFLSRAYACTHTHTHTHTVIFVITEIDWSYGLGYMFVGQASHFNSLQSVLRLPFGPNKEAQGALHLDDLGRGDGYLALQPSHWLTPHFLPLVQSQ